LKAEGISQSTNQFERASEQIQSAKRGAKQSISIQMPKAKKAS
jgi:hypothetical protein